MAKYKEDCAKVIINVSDMKIDLTLIPEKKKVKENKTNE